MKKGCEDVVFRTRSLGVAHSPCIMPSSGKPSFSLGEGEMELGVGHHGEPGIEKMKMMPADQVTDLIMEKILADLPFRRDDEVSVMINGLGSTALLELYIVYRRAAEILRGKGIGVHKAWVGEYFTSMEMGGFSITLTKLDAALKRCIDQPVNAVHFVQA
jgi:phosphoenolpyruvate---glycerone phosphotransferase subunit DhaK